MDFNQPQVAVKGTAVFGIQVLSWVCSDLSQIFVRYGSGDSHRCQSSLTFSLYNYQPKCNTAARKLAPPCGLIKQLQLQFNSN